jgi:hypothetical protein
LELDPVMIEKSLEELARRDPEPLLMEVSKRHDIAGRGVRVVLVAEEPPL